MAHRATGAGGNARRVGDTHTHTHSAFDREAQRAEIGGRQAEGGREVGGCQVPKFGTCDHRGTTRAASVDKGLAWILFFQHGCNFDQSLELISGGLPLFCCNLGQIIFLPFTFKS